jgi:hypothetical protein
LFICFGVFCVVLCYLHIYTNPVLHFLCDVSAIPVCHSKTCLFTLSLSRKALVVLYMNSPLFAANYIFIRTVAVLLIVQLCSCSCSCSCCTIHLRCVSQGLSGAVLQWASRKTPAHCFMHNAVAPMTKYTFLCVCYSTNTMLKERVASIFDA